MQKGKIYFIVRVAVLIFVFNNSNIAFAQTDACVYKDPAVTIDFGTLSNTGSIALPTLYNYSVSKTICPNDGQFCFAAFTANCFDGKWHSVMQDHTAGDVNGRMMIVNASVNEGIFFMTNINGLIEGKTYQISFWLINICKSADGCTPTPPNIKASLLSSKGEIVHFNTGTLSQTANPIWRNFIGEFTMPKNTTTIVLKMEDLVNGGCGNDFALDDITFKECIINKPPIVEVQKPTIEPQKPVAAIVNTPKPIITPKPVEKITPPKPITKPANDLPKAIIKPIEKQNTEVKVAPSITTKPKPVVIPKLIATRENALVRKIETEEAEMVIELYDNGEIDGDTVTIYHNNELVVNRAGLSSKPITIKIRVDKNAPHHELVMVANNLGSIPPNTSLMIVTANKKRYEVYISSSEQKNAKVVIDLK
jgi:hypothetical protein